MRFRKLRIGWSVFWGLACVLLIVLWVRSYWWFDMLTAPLHGGRELNISTRNGRLYFCWYFPSFPIDVKWAIESWDVAKGSEMTPAFSILGFGFYWRSVTGIVLPCWFVGTLVAGLSALPFVGYRCHFSLRTLLIATTLVAVVLGLIVWLR